MALHDHRHCEWKSHRERHDAAETDRRPTSECREPGSHVCLPRMPYARDRLRSRSLDPMGAGWADRRRASRSVVPTRSHHRPPRCRMDLPAASRRRLPVDEPTRPHLHIDPATTLTGRRRQSLKCARRTASESRIAAETDALRESAAPAIGIRTGVPTSNHETVTPACSEPITMEIGPVSSASQ